MVRNWNYQKRNMIKNWRPCRTHSFFLQHSSFYSIVHSSHIIIVLFGLNYMEKWRIRWFKPVELTVPLDCMYCRQYVNRCLYNLMTHKPNLKKKVA
jgi:hypothetical protein